MVDHDKPYASHILHKKQEIRSSHLMRRYLSIIHHIYAEAFFREQVYWTFERRETPDLECLYLYLYLDRGISLVCDVSIYVSIYLPNSHAS